jgi:hypothetical protein
MPRFFNIHHNMSHLCIKKCSASLMSKHCTTKAHRDIEVQVIHIIKLILHTVQLSPSCSSHFTPMEGFCSIFQLRNYQESYILIYITFVSTYTLYIYIYIYIYQKYTLRNACRMVSSIHVSTLKHLGSCNTQGVSTLVLRCTIKQYCNKPIK